ncbi:MAG: hypothetical protein ACRD3J_15955, partial [Thermoanaerobaculia bacterium]
SIDTKTIFMVGNPEDLAGVETGNRMIVLNESELEAASKKFGGMLASHMSPIVIDQTGTRAWVQINEAWRGSTYLLTRMNGAWIALAISTWQT